MQIHVSNASTSKYMLCKYMQPAHIETSHLICNSSQTTGFYMRGVLI